MPNLKLVSVARDMTAPYLAIESYVYDRFIAPAVLEFARMAAGEVLAGLPTRGHALDVGCGGGHFVAWLAEQYPEAEVTGVDLSPEQVARAQRRTAGFGRRVTIRQGSALELPFADEMFEAVGSIASIKHWPDPMRGVREIYRVLKPGGSFFIAEVDRGCRLEDAVRFVDRWRVPAPARKLAMPLFRTFVAGQGIDLEDAREMLRELGLAESGAKRIPGMPVVLLSGVKSVVPA